MAMSTWMQAVTEEDLAELRRSPGSVTRLDQPVYFRTHYGTYLNYVLTGGIFPSAQDSPLWPVLNGGEKVQTATLDNGSFGVVDSGQVADQADLLAAIDIPAAYDAIATAVLDGQIDHEGLDEPALLGCSADELPDVLAAEVAGLAAFYRTVADLGMALVTYTV